MGTAMRKHPEAKKQERNLTVTIHATGDHSVGIPDSKVEIDLKVPEEDDYWQDDEVRHWFREQQALLFENIFDTTRKHILVRFSDECWQCARPLNKETRKCKNCIEGEY